MCQKDVAIGRGNVFFPQTTQWILLYYSSLTLIIF